MTPEMIERLKKIARQSTVYDDLPEDECLNAYDFSGGNFDDAFSMGETAGEVLLARSILEELSVDWK